MEDYLSDVYDFITKQDGTFSGDVDIETFKSKMQDDSYAKEIYKYMSSVDGSFSNDIDESSFLNAVKKKDIQEVTSSMLEETQQEPTQDFTSELDQQDTSSENQILDVDQSNISLEPQPISQQEQLDNAVAESLGTGDLGFQSMSTNVNFNSPFDLQSQPTGNQYVYESDWQSSIPEMSQAIQETEQARESFFDNKGNKDGKYITELHNKIRYQNKILEDPQSYFDRVIPSEDEFSDLERSTIIRISQEQLLLLNKELDAVKEEEEYKKTDTDWNTFMYNSLKEAYPDADEGDVIQQGMDVGMNPYRIRTEAITINGENASYDEAHDYILLNPDELIENPDIIQFSEKYVGEQYDYLKKLKETQISAGDSQWWDGVQSFNNRTIGFASGLAEVNALVNPVYIASMEGANLGIETMLGTDKSDYRSYYSKMMEEGDPLAKVLKDYANNYSNENIRKYKYGISESVINKRYGDAIAQTYNMFGSAIFDLGLMYFTGGTGLALSSVSAGGDASLEVKEYNKTAAPEDKVGYAGIYANAAVTAGIIYGTELFTLGNIRAAKEFTDASLRKLKLSGIKNPKPYVPQPAIGDSFIKGLTRNPGIILSGATESATETLQEIGSKVTDYYTGLYVERDEDGNVIDKSFGEFVDEEILSYEMLDVAIGSFLPGAFPKAAPKTISYFVDQYVKFQREAQFTVENVATGEITPMTRNEFVKHIGKKENKDKFKNGKESWKATNASQIKVKIEQLLNEFGSQENTKKREQMDGYKNEVNTLSKELNVASKRGDSEQSLIDIATKIANIEAKMVDLSNSSNFVGIPTISLRYLHKNGEFRKFLRSRGLNIKSKLNSRMTNKNRVNVTKTTTDSEITSDEQLKSLEAQVKRKLKKPNVITKENGREVSKDKDVVSKADVEVNQFSSLAAAKKAVKDYKAKQAWDKQNETMPKTKNAKAYKDVEITDMDEMSETEFDEMMKSGDYHIISAEKSALSELQNFNRTSNLEQRLINEGIEYKKTIGLKSGKPEVSFIIKGKKTLDGKVVPLTDGEALSIARLIGQTSVVSGKKGLINTNSSFKSNAGTIIDRDIKDGSSDQGTDPLNAKSLSQEGATIINVAGKKVAISQRLGNTEYKNSFDTDNSSEFNDFAENNITPDKAKFLMPVLKFLNSIKGLSFNFYQDSEAVIRDLIKTTYESVYPERGPLDVDSINIDIDPNTDKVNVQFTPELKKALKDAGILEQVLQQASDIRSRGFFDSGDGSVSINLDRVAANTLFHELGHPVHEFLEEYDPELFDEINKELKNKSRWVFVDGVPKKQTYYEWASSNATYQAQAQKYASDFAGKRGKTREQLIDDFYLGEAFAEYLGDASAQKLNPSKARRFLNFIKENTVGLVRDDVENINLADFKKLGDLIDNLSTAFVTGQSISYKKRDVDVNFEVKESREQKLRKMKTRRKSLDDGSDGLLENGDFVSEGPIMVPDNAKTNRRLSVDEVDNPAIERGINMDDLEVVDPSTIDGLEVLVSAIDKSITANITSPTGVQHVMMGGVLYSMQDGAGIWAFTTRKAAQDFMNNLNKKGVSTVVLMTQANTGILGNLNFNEYFIKELKNSIDKGLVTEKQILDNFNDKLNKLTLKTKKGEPKRYLTSLIKEKYLSDDLTLPLTSLDQFELMMIRVGTVNRNTINKSFIDSNKKFLDKAGIPRFEQMLGYINDPVIAEAENGDLVAKIDIDVNSDIIETQEGDMGHHIAYPFVVQGSKLKLFNNFLDVREAFPKFRTYDTKKKKFNDPLEVKTKAAAARTIGLTTQTAEIQTKKTKRYSVISNSAEMSSMMEENYYLALELDAKNLSSDYIRQVTMWEKGEDGRFRYEIADGDFKEPFIGIIDAIKDDIADLYNEDANFRKEADEAMKSNDMAVVPYKILNSIADNYKDNPLTIKDIINDPVLDFYPEIADANLIFQIRLPSKNKANHGSFDPKTKTIYLNILPDVISKNFTVDDIFSTLKHEIQHYIQEIEGFPTGGNYRYFSKIGTNTLVKNLDELVQDGVITKSYRDQIIAYSDKINAQRKKDVKLKNQVKKLVAELMQENYINFSLESVIKAYPSIKDENASKIREILTTAIDKSSAKPTPRVSGLRIQYIEMIGELQSELGKLNKKYSGFNLYKSVYGEIEARVVQNRLNMDQAARLAESISESMNKEMESIGAQEKIILFRTEEQLEKNKRQPEILRQKLNDARDAELFPKKRLQIEDNAGTFDETLSTLDLNQDDVNKWRKDNKKPRKKRVPSDLIMRYANQEISFDEYTEGLKILYPYMFDTDEKIANMSVPDFTSFDLMVKALKSSQVEKGLIDLNKTIPNGTRVGSRLDINANGDFGVLCNSIHTGDSRGKVLGYSKFSLLTGVTFRTNPNTALAIGLGEVNKSPFARMEGSWNNASEQDVQSVANNLLQRMKDGDPNVVRVSMRPDMASYFFDTKTGLPLDKADRLVQIGGFILAENPVLTSPSDPRFMAESDQYPTIKRYQDVEEDYKDVESNGFRSMVFESILNSSDVSRLPSDWIEIINKFPGSSLEAQGMNIDQLLNNFQSENNLKTLSRSQVLELVSNNLPSEQEAESMMLPRLQLDEDQDDQEFLSFSTPAMDILFGIRKAAINLDYKLGEYLTQGRNKRAGLTTKIENVRTETDPIRVRATSFLINPENTFNDPRLTDLFIKMHGELAVAMDQAKRKAVIFQLAISQSKKGFTPRELTGYLRGYNETLDENNELVRNYTDINDLDEVVTISLFGKKTEVNIRDLMIEMREDIDNLSMKGLETGAFTGDMAASVKENFGFYLHRQYKKHALDSYEVPQENVDRSKELIRESILALKNNTLDPVEDAVELDALVETTFSKIFSGSNMNDLSQEGLTPSQVSVVKSIYKQRSDIILEIREIMGEIHDPLITYLSTVAKQNRSIGTHFMLDQMQKIGEGKFWSSQVVNGQFVGNGLVRQLDSKFGAFEGHYVSDEIFAVLNNVYQDKQKGGLEGLLYGLTLLTKWSKTVGNFPTHLRNLMGNFAFILQSGHLPITPERMKFAVASFKTVVNNFRYKPESKKQETYEYLKERGIMTQDTELGLLDDLYNDLNKSNFDITLHTKNKFNRLVSALKNVPRAMNKIYQSEDEIFKIYGFLVEEARYKRAGLSESQAREKAASIITNTYPNYSKIPNVVRLIGKFPLFGTFVAFQSESLRVGYNSALIAKEELSSSNPTIRKIGAERLAGITTNNILTDAAYRALSVIGLTYFAGEGEDDEGIYGTKLGEMTPNKMFRMIVPHYNKTGNLSIVAKGFLVGDNKKSFEGQLNNDAYVDFFDSSKIDGTGFQKNMMRIMLGDTETEDDFSTLLELYNEFLGPFFGTDITVQSINDAIKLREDLIRKGYSNYQANKQVTNMLLSDLAPSMIENTIIATKGLFSSEETDVLLAEEMEDETIPPEQAALRLLGITNQRVNVNKALFFGARSRYGKMQAELERLGMKYSDLNDPKVLGIVDTNEELSSRLRDLMNFVSANKYFGDLHEQDIDAVLSAAGVSTYIKDYIRYNKPVISKIN